MSKNYRKLSYTTLATAVAFACASATPAIVLAQDPPEQGPAEEVIVTGSRIMRTSGFTTPVPVTAVTPDQLSMFEPGTTITEQLDQLPQFYLTQSAQRGGGTLFGGAGRSNLNMRAMGAQRTLVLLDGARISPADRDGSVHTDNIPTALLSQVEIVTGGASAAYGADALAGVVNFRLNREFEGLNVDVGAGATEEGYGETVDLSVAFGTRIGDRLHFIGSLESQNIDEINPEPHELGDWFQRYGLVGNPDPNGPSRLIMPNTHSTRHTPTGRIRGAFDATGAGVPFTFDGFNFNYAGDGVRPFVDGDLVGTSLTTTQSGGPEADIANRAFGSPGGMLAAEVKRRNIFTGLTFDASDSTRLWINLFAGETQSNQWDRRAIPHGTTPWNMTIFSTNPFLPDSVRDSMIAEGVDSFRMEKQGSVFGQDGNWGDSEDRVNEFSSWTFQFGIDQQLGDNWNLQARFQRGATDKFTANLNEDRIDRRYVAMDAVEVYADFRDLTDDAGNIGPDGLPDLTARADWGTGTNICNVQRYNPTTAQLQAAVAGFLVPAPQGDDSLGGPSDRVPIPGPIGPDNVVRDCIPANFFGQGNVGQEFANYVSDAKWGRSAVTQEFAEILVTGDISDGIGDAGPFSMAVGATYREQWFWQRGYPVDLMAYGPPRNAPQLGIRGIAPGYTGGSPNLHEFSTVPVISGGYDVWEAFAEFNLPLWDNGSQRLELDIAGRYSDYSTSGGINSNKLGINFNVTPSFRIRATTSRDVREPTFAERFNRQGGGGNIDDPFRGGQNFEITTTAGGNPGLSPEEADTITVGFVLQPVGAPGLQFSVDWFEIDLSQAVGQLGTQDIVDQCWDTGNAELCGLVRRDPPDTNTTCWVGGSQTSCGPVTNVDRIFLNIDSAKVRGMDYELLWNTEPDFLASQDESLSFRLLAGRMFEDSTTVQGGSPVDRSGRHDQPDFTALASVRYQFGAVGINLQQRYIPEGTLNHSWTTGNQVSDNTVESASYTDLTLLYDGELSGGRAWQAAFSITNLFDTDPPVEASFSQRFSAQSVPNNYDVFGRRYMLNFRYSY